MILFLLNETLPMGISSKKLDHRNLESVPLFEDHVILITHPDHPWVEYGCALPADLINQPIIVSENTSGTCEAVVEGLKAFDITIDMLNIAMELGNAEAIKMSVEKGVGIAFVSEMVAARGLAMGRSKKSRDRGPGFAPHRLHCT